jgi:serine/threonine protein kinase
MNDFLQLILHHDMDPVYAKEMFQDPIKAQQFCSWFEQFVREEMHLSDQMDIIPLKPLTLDVMLAYDNIAQTLVARKRIPFKEGPWCIPLHAIYELYSFVSLAPLHSDHLQSLLNFAFHIDYLDIVSHYIPISFDPLFSDPLPLEFVMTKVQELIDVVKLLHKHNIAHRDIKAENICFDIHGRLVLLDFDCAVLGSIRTTLPMCTLTTRAPELMQEQKKKDGENVYDAFAADWWSVACVICHMFLCKPLFPEEKEHEVLEHISFVRQQLTQPGGFGLLKRKMPCNLYLYVKEIFTCEPSLRCEVKLHLDM